MNRVFVLLLVAMAFQPVLAMHHEPGPAHSNMEVTVSDAWSPAVPPMVAVRAGYFVVSNRTEKTIKVVGVESSVFASVEMHESIMKDGMMSMPEKESIIVNAGESIEFKPGGLHLMMMQPQDSIASSIPVKLLLANGKAVEFEVMVKKKGEHSVSMSESNHGAHHHY